ELPDFRDFGVEVAQPGGKIAEATKVLGAWFAAVAEANPHIFRVFGPDETASNRLQDMYEVTDKQWVAEYESPEVDQHLARAGQVLEVLSEHQCQGWLEGYLLTGRHGVMNSYEAFIHIVDSMFNQHAKWLKVTNELEWRAPIASLNYLLSSHVWRRTTTGSPTKILVSSTTSSIRRRRSCACTCRPMPTRSFRRSTTACAPPSTSTSSCAGSNPTPTG